AGSAGPASGVHQDQKLHQVLVGGRAGRLYDEYVPATDVFVDLDEGLAIGKRRDRGVAERYADAGADALRQLAVGGAGKNLQFARRAGHLGKKGGATVGRVF